MPNKKGPRKVSSRNMMAHIFYFLIKFHIFRCGETFFYIFMHGERVKKGY